MQKDRAASRTIAGTRRTVLARIEDLYVHVLALEAVDRRRAGRARDLRFEAPRRRAPRDDSEAADGAESEEVEEETMEDVVKRRDATWEEELSVHTAALLDVLCLDAPAADEYVALYP